MTLLSNRDFFFLLASPFCMLFGSTTQLNRTLALITLPFVPQSMPFGLCARISTTIQSRSRSKVESTDGSHALRKWVSSFRISIQWCARAHLRAQMPANLLGRRTCANFSCATSWRCSGPSRRSHSSLCRSPCSPRHWRDSC